MHVQPAHVDQIAQGMNGRMVLIDADVGGVAADLKALDEGLKVRFAERSECFVVFHEKHGDCPHNATQDSYLVASVKATPTRSGTYAGLDQRLVDRMRLIDPSKGHYNYADELERQTRRRHEELKQARMAILEPVAEKAAHALRKDLGARYKGRTFVPREIP